MRSSPDSIDRDRRLVRDVLASRRSAVDELVARLRCVPRILAATNAKFGRPLDDHDLADVAQDTLVLVWRKLPQYEARSELLGWVYRICVLQWMNAARRKRRRRPAGIVPAAATAEEDGSSALRHEALHRALERLPADEAEVIRLKHFDGLSLGEVATRLERPLSSVKTRYYRGIARLQSSLAACEEGIGR